ncbi:hypothetical protein [Oscillatoria sp. FACHB-1406]|uniref:hypothetical protein n=1 Tax=Oscillatoria sp. FACHB-1406 TaxID=2692846 RepID=UPI00168451DA|nr:hypothetical protein [Oscillatoria sp. FACHB-1406]MBD2579641.1 hypothetical protein [Oscillatoria sp. FACHB-1406]
MQDLSKIWNCPDNLKFQCPQKWESLSSTDDENIRYCTVCSENVYNCSTPKDFVQYAKAGNCVALPNELARRPEDPHLFLGKLSQETIEVIKQQNKLIYRFRAWWRKALEIEPLLFNAFIKNSFNPKFSRIVERGEPPEKKALASELLELGQFDKVVEIARSCPSEGFLKRLVENLVRIGELNVALEVANLFETCNFKVISLNLIASELAKSGQHEQALNTIRLSLQTARDLTCAREKYEQKVIQLATSLGISL